MNRTLQLGAIGFVMGVLLMYYFETRINTPEPAQAAEETAERHSPAVTQEAQRTPAQQTKRVSPLPVKAPPPKPERRKQAASTMDVAKNPTPDVPSAAPQKPRPSPPPKHVSSPPVAARTARTPPKPERREQANNVKDEASGRITDARTEVAEEPRPSPPPKHVTPPPVRAATPPKPERREGENDVTDKAKSETTDTRTDLAEKPDPNPPQHKSAPAPAVVRSQPPRPKTENVPTSAPASKHAEKTETPQPRARDDQPPARTTRTSEADHPESPKTDASATAPTPRRPTTSLAPAPSADPKPPPSEEVRKPDPVRANHEPQRAAKEPEVKHRDSRAPLDMKLLRFFVGGEVAATRVVPSAVLTDQAKHGRYLVYFELSVTNPAEGTRQSVDYADFRLEDTKGLIYVPLKPRDCLNADLNPAETTRGGVAFAVYNDSAPARLLFRTGIETFTALPEALFWSNQDREVRHR